jgi:hypothetical protein
MTEKQREYNKKYYEANKEKRRLEYQANKDKIIQIVKEYKVKNADRIKETKKQYRQKNKEKISEYQRERRKDDLFKLANYLKTRIGTVIKKSGFKKTTRTEQILGCTFEEFKLYLESKFEPWMNWDNYGNPKDGIYELNKTWDIDHIIPLSTATNEIELIKLCYYTNLQPLCSYTNRFIKRNILS